MYSQRFTDNAMQCFHTISDLAIQNALYGMIKCLDGYVQALSTLSQVKGKMAGLSLSHHRCGPWPLCSLHPPSTSTSSS